MPPDGEHLSTSTLYLSPNLKERVNTRLVEQPKKI